MGSLGDRLARSILLFLIITFNCFTLVHSYSENVPDINITNELKAQLYFTSHFLTYVKNDNIDTDFRIPSAYIHSKTVIEKLLLYQNATNFSIKKSEKLKLIEYELKVTPFFIICLEHINTIETIQRFKLTSATTLFDLLQAAYEVTLTLESLGAFFPSHLIKLHHQKTLAFLHEHYNPHDTNHVFTSIFSLARSQIITRLKHIINFNKLFILHFIKHFPVLTHMFDSSFLIHKEAWDDLLAMKRKKFLLKEFLKDAHRSEAQQLLSSFPLIKDIKNEEEVKALFKRILKKEHIDNLADQFSLDCILKKYFWSNKDAIPNSFKPLYQKYSLTSDRGDSFNEWLEEIDYAYPYLFIPEIKTILCELYGWNSISLETWNRSTEWLLEHTIQGSLNDLPMWYDLFIDYCCNNTEAPQEF